MLKAVSNEAQRQRLNGDRSLFLGAPVSRHARESGNVRQPATILFTEVFDGQAESAFQWCIRQASMMAANRGSSPGCLAPPSFGTKAALASAAAWSPNPKNPPLYIDAVFTGGKTRVRELDQVGDNRIQFLQAGALTSPRR